MVLVKAALFVYLFNLARQLKLKKHKMIFFQSSLHPILQAVSVFWSL